MVRAIRAKTQPEPRVQLPKLALHGDPAAVQSVRTALGELQVSLETLPSVDAVCAAEGLVGIVLVDLDSKLRLAPKMALLRDNARAPAFAVVREELSDRSVRKLYTEGAAGVFAWPRESLLLGRFLAEMLALRLTRGRAKEPDVALARTVRTHLKLVPGLNQIPRLQSRDGFVSASGSVDSLPLKREVEQTISNVPGVRFLDVVDLHVIPDPVSDRKIQRAALRLLHAASEIDARTLSVSVDSGHLIMEGTAKDRRELRRLEECVTGIEGVRNVELRVAVSASKHQIDRTAARRLKDALSIVFPHENVRVAYYSGIAVLTGTAESLRTKRAIAAFAVDHPAVLRLVNKIEVRS